MIAIPRMTLDEFLSWQDLPENCDRRFELIEGEVIEMSRPSVKHGRICLKIGHLLENYLDSIGKGTAASNDSGVLLQLDPPTLKGPDIVLFADTLTDEQESTLGLKTRPVPTLVVEIRSPEDRTSPLHEKVRLYLNAGVSLVWVVEPEDKVVKIFKRGADDRVAKLEDTLDGNGVLPDLSIRVAEVFKVRGIR